MIVDDVEAVVEVLAEGPLGDQLRRSRLVAATTRTSTGMGSLPPTRRIVALLERAQELRLQRRGSSPISSRKQRAAVGRLEQAAPGGDGAGERAALVAEQLGLEQRLGQRRAVDRHERAVGARAARRGCARATSSLPVPVSPSMSTVASSAGHARDQLVDLRHLVRLAHQRVDALPRLSSSRNCRFSRARRRASRVRRTTSLISSIRNGLDR